MIDVFDEYQGLTADMVREWLVRQGYSQVMCPSYIVCAGLGGHTHYDASGRCLTIPSCGAVQGTKSVTVLTGSLELLAAIREQSIQSLLREINPRMRGPGYPSDAAARAHGDGGWWVFQHQQGADDPRSVTKPGELHMAQMCLSSAFNDVRFYWERGLMGEPCDEACMWWPCDANGNKVRWPERDGVML